MIKRFALSALSLAAAASVALAADIPVKNPRAAPPYAAPLRWTGPWLAVGIGGGWSDGSIGVTGGNPNSNSILANNFYPRSINVDRSGWTLSASAGYDWQFAPQFVAGVLARYSYSAVRGTAYAGGNLVGVQYDERIKNVWDLLGKVGWIATADGRALVSLIGGASVATIKSSVASAGFAGGSIAGSSSTDKWGWSVGAEFEYRLPANWFAKANYIFTDFRDVSTQVAGTVGGTPLLFTDTASVKLNRAGIEFGKRF